MNREPLNSSSPFAVVVNDDPTQLNVLSGLVRKAGLEPRAFTGAEAALAEMSARVETADRYLGIRQPDLPNMPGALQTGKTEKISKTEGDGAVLLVEDEDMVRNMAKLMLTRPGYTVLEAKDGGEALEIFQQYQNEICCFSLI
jgi:CheY-like chemotaxis protein